MDRNLVLTVIGEDRPGLVELLAQTIAEHDGHWLEGRMSQLAGKFAGILRVRVPRRRAAELGAALRALGGRGLRVTSEEGRDTVGALRSVGLELVGADHPGIVRDLANALARRGVNVEELETRCEDAPMSGQKLFRAEARLQLPAALGPEQLRRDLESLAADLMVDLTLDET